MYRPSGSCTTQFLEDFLALSGFLSSTSSSFISGGDLKNFVVILIFIR